MHKNCFCFVPGCKSGYPSQRRAFKLSGQRNPSLFSCERNNKETLRKWNRAIPRVDKQFTLRDRVCELHFFDSDIQRYFITKMPDGSVHKLERERPLLTSGAIPSIFPTLPKYFTKTKERRKPPAERLPLPKKQKQKRKYSHDPSPKVPGSPEVQFDLRANMQLVKLPGNFWSIQSNEHYVMCAKWNKKFKPEKKVAIMDDFSVKVFIQECELDIDEKISSVEAFSIFLQKVDKFVLCAGVNDKIVLSTDCLGYVPFMNTHGPAKMRCESCIKARNLEGKRDRRRREFAKKQIDRKRALYQRKSNADKKCEHLLKKVTELKNKLKASKLKCSAVQVEMASKLNSAAVPVEAIHEN